MNAPGQSMQHRLRALRGQLRKMLPLVEGMLEAGDVREVEPAYVAPQGEDAGGPSGSRWRIEHYGPRFFALYEGDELVAVTVYKRGAESVRDRLQAQQNHIAELTRALDARRVEGSAVERVRAERESRGTRER